MTIPHCVIFKAQLSPSASRLGEGVFNTRPAVDSWPQQGALCDWPYLFWLQAETQRLTLPVFHVRICIYHFITPTRVCSTMWLLLLIFTGVSCTEIYLIDSSVKGQYAMKVYKKEKQVHPNINNNNDNNIFRCVYEINLGVRISKKNKYFCYSIVIVVVVVKVINRFFFKSFDTP